MRRLGDFFDIQQFFPYSCFFKAKLELARLHVLYLLCNKLKNIEKLSWSSERIDHLIARGSWKKAL
jgi:hypothetical protein